MTVTIVPRAPGSNVTSTKVFSSGRKLTLRHSKAMRVGGSQAVTRPVSMIFSSPCFVSNDSNNRPSGPGSMAMKPRRLPATRN